MDRVYTISGSFTFRDSLSTTAALGLKRPSYLAIPSDYLACFGSRGAAFSIGIDSSYVSAAVVLDTYHKARSNMPSDALCGPVRAIALLKNNISTVSLPILPLETESTCDKLPMREGYGHR